MALRKKVLPCSCPITPHEDALATIEHQQWAHWTRHMLDVIRDELSEHNEKLGRFFESKVDCVRRWRRQCEKPFSRLSDEEKESDKVEVRLKFTAYKAAITKTDGPDLLDERYMTVADANRDRCR